MSNTTKVILYQKGKKPTSFSLSNGRRGHDSRIGNFSDVKLSRARLNSTGYKKWLAEVHQATPTQDLDNVGVEFGNYQMSLETQGFSKLRTAS